MFLLFSLLVSLTHAAPPECAMCVLQRPGNLGYILRRAMGGEESALPDESDTFGHCFVCIQCRGEPSPYCVGWWPADPDGGDYEGDEGLLQRDEDESWTRAGCSAISTAQAEQSLNVMTAYDVNHTYQVTNKGGRSCLGFCQDVASSAGLRTFSRAGDLTVPGRMSTPGAQLKLKNPSDVSPGVLMQLVLTGDHALIEAE